MFYLKFIKKRKNMITKYDFAVLNLEAKPTIWIYRSILLKNY
jgi:hypothetical protein